MYACMHLSKHYSHKISSCPICQRFLAVFFSQHEETAASPRGKRRFAVHRCDDDDLTVTNSRCRTTQKRCRPLWTSILHIERGFMYYTLRLLTPPMETQTTLRSWHPDFRALKQVATWHPKRHPNRSLRVEPFDDPGFWLEETALEIGGALYLQSPRGQDMGVPPR